jgi:C-terminal processing protease CtpA/Prc
MLHGTRIEETLIGGPSFGVLFKGDDILKIDGKPVSSDDIVDALRGPDIPGTKVLLTIQRHISSMDLSRDPDDDELLISGTVTEMTVELTRMATAEIADRRRLFDLFTVCKVPNPYHECF